MLDEYYHIDNLILKNSKLDSKIKKNKLYLNYTNYFFIKIFNYDLIFTHGRRSIEYYNKIKTIYNLLNIKTPPNITRIWNYDKLKVINNCDYTIINCQYYRDYLKKINYRGQIFYLDPPMKFNNTKIDNNFINVDKLTIGCIARFVEKKGIFDFLNLVKRLPTKFNYVLAGDGVLKDKILEFINENDLNINYLGWLEDTLDFYKNIDILLVPSYQGPLENVIFDGMLNNKLVVSSDTFGPREFIENNDLGIIYPKKNIDYLTKLFIDICENRKKYLEKINNGYIFSKNLDSNNQKPNLKKIIEQIKDIEENNLNIHHEFEKIKNRLLKNEYFTFVRFGDGEIHYIERTENIHEEHTTKKGEISKELANLMKKSLEFNKENYYRNSMWML